MPTISGSQLWEWRICAQQDARQNQIPIAEVDWLLFETTNLDRLKVKLGAAQTIEAITLQLPWSEIQHLWQQRLKQKLPLQYLLGRTHWREFTLTVTPAVLIPRPETEYLIDLAIKAVQAQSSAPLAQGNWVDLGTGSGAIALGLAKIFPQAVIHAVDCSATALAIAQQNVAQYDLSSRVSFYLGSWWSPLANLRGKVAGMVANPPYIPQGAIATLQPEVVRHEPHLALEGGNDGLIHLRELVHTAPTYLCTGGVWLVEIMTGQGEKVAAMLRECGAYQNIEIIPDFAGHDRYVLAYHQ